MSSSAILEHFQKRQKSSQKMERYVTLSEHKILGFKVSSPFDRRSRIEIAPHVIAACQQGDREAFRQLYEAYKDRVYSIAFHFFRGDETLAEDITQQVFLKLMDCVGQFRNEAEFETWLYRLVKNACIDEQRGRRRFVLFGVAVEKGASDGESPQVDATEILEQRLETEPDFPTEIAAAVEAAVATLKPKLRMTLLLKYFDDLSYDEMAKALGCSQGTVASRLNRAHKILARKLAHLRDELIPGGER
jgi:RNA polymerase sigma-70 factor (ECF subfamily)